MILSKQLINRYLEKLPSISQFLFHVAPFFENLWLFYVNSYLLVRVNSNGYGESVPESVSMHKFVYIQCIVVPLFFACDKYPKLTTRAHIPSAECDYNRTNTNLPSIFVKMFIEFSNIKSTSLKISD